jgi:hypothetical protein
MVKGSLADKFKKLQKDVGNPLEGPEFAGRYCIFLGEFLDNPAKLAHERDYEAHCRTSDPVGALLALLRRHFEDHKEGKAQEWVQFRRESGEDLPSLLFRLQGLALDLGEPLGDQELVVKFVTSLDRRLGDQTNSQALAGTSQAGGAYTLEEAYEAALRVTAMNAGLKIAREQVPKFLRQAEPEVVVNPWQHLRRQCLLGSGRGSLSQKRWLWTLRGCALYQLQSLRSSWLGRQNGRQLLLEVQALVGARVQKKTMGRNMTTRSVSSARWRCRWEGRAPKWPEGGCKAGGV